MRKVKRTLLIDPDTKEQYVKIFVPLGPEGDDYAATLAAVQELLEITGLPHRLACAKEALAKIKGLPEYDEALRCYARADHFVAVGKWERAENELSRGRAQYEHGMRRKLLWEKREQRRKGGTNAGKNRRAELDGRNKKICAKAKSLARTEAERNIAGILAPQFGLTPATIRKILK